MEVNKQKALDEKVHMHVSDLQAQSNTLAPIYKLSNEILLRIFEALKDDEFNPADNYLARVFLPKHIVVKVCKHWRAVAFGAAALWNKPPLWDEYWGMKHLELSNAAALDVKFFFTEKHLMTAALRHMKRIRSLYVEYYYDDMVEVQKYLLDNSDLDAPQLEKLVLHSRTQMSDADRRPLDLSNNTFRSTSALRSLTIIYVRIKWDTSPLLQGHLTTLELIDIPVAARPSWKQLMAVLRRSRPTLETLKLSRACPLNGGSGMDDPVHLPSLRSFNLYCETATLIASFLEQVTFPRLHEVCMGCASFSEGATHYTEVFTHLLKLLPPEKKVGDAVEIMKLGIGIRRGFDGEGMAIALESPATQSYPTIHLRLPALQRYSDKEALSSILKSLAIDKLRFLGFYCMSFNGMLNECFHSQAALEEIELGQDAGELPSLIQGLEILTDHPSDAPIQFPKLRTVRLTQVHLPWRKNHSDRNYDPCELNPRITWTQLRDCFVERAKHGAPIEKLYVEECVGFSKMMINFFLEVVPTVIVDGVRQAPANGA